MKKIILWFCLLLLAGFSAAAQKKAAQIKYYRVDQVKTIKGEILEIKKEPASKKSVFTVLLLEEQDSGERYRVEVAPGWFFKTKKMKTGNKVEVTGSYCCFKDKHTIIARTLTFGKKKYYFRDKNGFPLWRQGKRRFISPRGSGRGRKRGKGRR
ncbi:MAG: hypothetical protein KAW12_06330 [Candidatus Aminicenantes bacterium]|nr:hypothetical protein [Candidatus Aminicenantes bacterium]